MRRTALLFLATCLSASAVWASDAPVQKAKKPPVPVIAYEVKPIAIPVHLQVLGRLESIESVDIAANVTERVKALHFKDGEFVRKSQLLVELNAEEEFALLEEAKEAAEEAKRQYDRVKEIEGRGTVTRSLIDERYRQWKTAEAKRKVIQAQIADRRIYAPFAGQVGLRNISVGALVQPGTKIVSLDDTRQMRLDLLLPSRYLRDLKLGQTVEIESTSYPGRRFSGQLEVIAPRVDETIRMVKARAMVDNPKGELKSQMMVQAFIELPTQEQLMVPNTAILMLGDRQFVYRMVPGQKPDVYQLERVEIETGERRNRMTQVVSGLETGDWVVSQGLMGISLNRPVSIKAMQQGQPQPELLKKSSSQSAVDVSTPAGDR
ncbi:efflux RND transporter periplasmic adaptor subunit [Thiomicrospira sp. S5]|uniref:efflux RND transporter periplasmic adaptor subunit n=1 Tax=Thiomicrospira sp. S5 TaxID=1803865 RepID=UPI000F8A1189|nr:efflux RND transporter periplasmic adaptor subunit [Thiomicrospira sp. S5]AZR81181.1 efflux transporter periplasmic adaptor subunit [Thiomicrospira sp. S5]